MHVNTLASDKRHKSSWFAIGKKKKHQFS